jgi:IS30 family transposase
MKRSPLTAEEQDEVWRPYRRGMSLRSIGKAMGLPTWTAHSIVAFTGGLRPAARTRSPLWSSLAEREEISRGAVAGEPCRAIGRRLGRAASTVSRELSAHGGRRKYRAWEADQAVWRQARRAKRPKLVAHPRLRAIVVAKLRLRWSPQQIAGWLRREHGDDPELQVSHETIYSSLFVQSRGALKKELTPYLRTRRVMRQPRATHRSHGGGQLRDPINVSARPAEADDRAVPGHWEGDLLLGSGNSAIVTLVERSSRYVILSNENTNGLLRQYFPKRTDLARVTQRQLDAVARQLNGSPSTDASLLHTIREVRRGCCDDRLRPHPIVVAVEPRTCNLATGCRGRSVRCSWPPRRGVDGPLGAREAGAREPGGDWCCGRT